MGVMEPRWRTAERQFESLQATIKDLEARLEMLEGVERSNPTWPRINKIIQTVSGFFDVSDVDILSHRRPVHIVTARHVAMWATRHGTEHSYSAIARQFGKDHTTIIHAVQAVEDRRERDPAFKEKTDRVLEFSQ